MSYSQWTQVNLYTGDIRDIDASDSLIFTAAGMAGVYKTNQPTAGWTYWSTQFTSPPYTSVVDVKDSVIFCGGGYDEIYQSVDYGNTWSNVILNPGVMTMLNDVCIGDSFVFALTNYGLFRSSDTGLTWQACNGPLPAYFMEKLYDDGNVLYVLSEDSGLYRSSDYGMNWIAVNNGFFPSCMVTSLVRNGGFLILGTFCGYVYRSTDNGISWTMTGMGTGSSIRCMTLQGSDLYAGTYAGVMKSSDNGYSWTSWNNGISHTPVVCLGTWQNKVLAGTAGGIYYLESGNTLWERVCDGIYGGNFLAFTEGSGAVYTFDNMAGIFYSEDHGDSWQIRNSGLSDYNLFMLEMSGSQVYAGYAGGLLSSSTLSTVWTTVQGGFPSLSTRCLSTLGSTIFAGLDNGKIYKSDNGGSTWYLASTGLVSVGINTIFSSAGHLFAHSGNDLFLSPDFGATWNLIYSNPDIINFIAATPSSIMLVSPYLYVIYVSFDLGQTWSQVSFPVPLNALYINDIISIGNDYFISCNKGVFHSPDNGTTWTDISAGLPVANTEKLGYDGTYLFVNTEKHGAYRLLASQITGTKQADSDELTAFPNPASEKVTIRASEKMENLFISDISGRIVRAHNFNSCNEISIDVTGLQAGFYFITCNGKKKLQLQIIK